ncbi:hypothetical protein HanIR_Chr02g0092821 [Helianthus annuus]|nr:hypothetical protein HanIR_Chr02g0092821 [Helianthus annuus]
MSKVDCYETVPPDACMGTGWNLLKYYVATLDTWVVIEYWARNDC